MHTNRAVCESKEIRGLGQFRDSSWRGGSFHQDFPTTCMDVIPASSSQHLRLLDLVQSPATSATGHSMSEIIRLVHQKSEFLTVSLPKFNCH